MRTALALFVVGSALAQAPQEALLDYDLSAGSLRIVAASQSIEVHLAADSLALAWDRYVAELATQAFDPVAAAHWGGLLLPVESAPLLRASPRWRIVSPQLVGLDAVIAPWANDSPVLAHYELVFGADVAIPPRGEGALALQPFHVADVSIDVPDTLDAALALGLRKLEHLPRNDVDPSLLRTLFRERDYELLSLRAALPLPDAWSSQWSTAPPLRLWSWPSAATMSDRAAWQRELAHLTDGGAVVADRWPLSERERAGDLAAWLAHLQAGESVGAALRRVKRELWQGGTAPRRWAGWIVLGDAEYRLESQTPGRLQSWLRRHRARSLGVELPVR